MLEVARQAVELRRLHAGPAILVLVLVWDVASARTVAALPGCPGIATGNWPIAASLGVPDGEVLRRDEMLAVAGRIAAAVDLPVTPDLEAGYGATPADVGETVRQAIAAGIAGCNIEDGSGRWPRPSPGSPLAVRPRTPTAPGSSSTRGST
jgi:2-methylisocitrate lyase-like PEP mutase family enzyme